MCTVCTRKNTKKPLNREHTCPRWDSNRVPPLDFPPLPRKPPQSGPVRPMYNSVRSQRCAHCAHLHFCPLGRHQPDCLDGRPGRDTEKAGLTLSLKHVSSWIVSTRARWGLYESECCGGPGLLVHVEPTQSHEAACSSGFAAGTAGTRRSRQRLSGCRGRG
jgi:hypothetical protein